jgi:hypothetical protein
MTQRVLDSRELEAARLVNPNGSLLIGVDIEQEFRLRVELIDPTDDAVHHLPPQTASAIRWVDPHPPEMKHPFRREHAHHADELLPRFRHDERGFPLGGRSSSAPIHPSLFAVLGLSFESAPESERIRS